VPTTPIYDLPWPLSTATPDVPRDLQALAEGTETGLRRHGAWASATATLTSVPAGSTSPALTGLTQVGGYTLAAGNIVAPYDGMYLSVMAAKIDTAQVQVWLGTSAGSNLGITINGAQIEWDGLYISRETRTAGQPITRPTVYGAPNVYDGSLSQTVFFLGDPV
jgi:hypothetical protein